jgi:quinol-cytochrome oxidoreductase complex cytochrome b subunit
VVRVLAIVGFVLLAVGMAIYIAWMILGAWLISTMSGRAVATGHICRRLIAYVIFLVAYIVVLIGVTVASCIWAAHGGAREDESKKARPSKKSQLKMPPVSVI